MTQVKRSQQGGSGDGERAVTLLNRTAEYALRATAALAAVPTDQAIPSRDLAEQTEIPQHYLAKILRRLVLADVLRSRKGHGGGFHLARPRGEITFHDVLSAVEFEIKKDKCVFGWGDCNPADPCPLHPAFSRLTDVFTLWAQNTTLDDLRLPFDPSEDGVPPTVIAPPVPRPPAAGGTPPPA